MSYETKSQYHLSGLATASKFRLPLPLSRRFPANKAHMLAACVARRILGCSFVSVATKLIFRFAANKNRLAAASPLISFVFTCATFSAASTRDQVVSAIRVSLRAMCLGGVDGGQTNASQIIDLSGDKFDVGRVDTRRITAQMIANQFIRNVPHEEGVGQSVSQSLPSERKIIDKGVAFIGQAFLPLPTGVAFVKVDGGKFDVREDANKNFEIDAKITILRGSHAVFSCSENSVMA